MRAARATARRDLLLAAAYDAVVERGYEATTISDIVRRAGVAQGTFYNAFAGKHELPAAFADALLAALTAAAARAVAERGTMRAVVDAAHRTATAFDGVLPVAARGLAEATTDGSWPQRTRFLRDALRPLLPPDAPDARAAVLCDLLLSAIRESIVSNRDDYADEVVRLVDLALAEPGPA